MKVLKFYFFVFLFMFSVSGFSQNWDWARHVKGADSISTEVVAIDNNDNVIIGGKRRGTIEFVGSSPLVTMTSAAGVNSPFIAKYSENGNLLWANGLGGTVASNIKSIVTDASGNTYAVGSFQGTDYVFRSQDGNNLLLTSGGGIDPYLLKYNPDGNLLWVKRFATASGMVRTSSVILDNSNNIILAGFFQAGTPLDFGGGTSFDFSGTSNNGYIAKFDNDGNLIWAKHFPGTWARIESGLALCQSEGFFATITIQTSVTIPGFGTINSTNGAGYELIFVKFNNSGDAQWVRHSTNTNDAYGGNQISSDEDGNGYFTGRFRVSTTFPNPSGTPVTLNSAGSSYDNFLVKYSKDGTLLNAVPWGGVGEDWTRGVDYFNNIVTSTGFFAGTMIINPGNTADTLISKGGRDAFLVNFDKNLNYLSSTSVGGTLNDEGWSIAIDNEGSPVFGGFFISSTINFGTETLTNGGTQQDLFLAKYVDIRITATSNSVSCFGGANGSIGITISGTGTPPITYTVHLGANLIASGTYSVPFSVPDLVAGTYKITATDNAGKSKTKYVGVTQPTAQLSGTINVTHITTCFGAAEGSISITGAAGGWGTYEYSINGGTSWQSSNIFNNLLAGIYHVMIRDAAYPICAVTLNSNVEITQPTEISVMVSPTNITCNGLTDGQIVITATGGSGSYQYSINDGVSYQASNTFLNLAPGLYKIKVNDGFCIKSGGSVNIVNPDPIVVGSVVVGDISCNGSIDGTITVINVTGGSGSFEYSINGINFFDNGGVFTGLPADDYDLFIKDSYGCIISAGTYTINEPTMVVISSVITQNITLCHEDLTGEITISAAGGTGSLSYSIDGGINWQITSGVFTGLAAGSYNIKVKDANNCETTWASNPVVITQPLQLIISNVVKNNISCFGRNDGKITITATGGTGAYEYSLNGSTWQALNEFTNLTNNTYRAYVRDQNSCVTQWGVDIVITEPAVLAITNVQITLESHAGAANGSLTFTVSGGTTPYNFTLTPGGATNQTGIFTGLSKNTYSVNVTDLNGCVVEMTGILLGITGIDDGQIDRRLNVYPNPSSGHFFIEIDNPLNKELIISIYNSLGQLVFSDKVSSLESFVKKEINLENQSKGTYMLRISGFESSVVRKLIIL